jgi:alpha-L-fucosidase
MKTLTFKSAIILAAGSVGLSLAAYSAPNDNREVQGQHAGIGAVDDVKSTQHTQNPDAQWFPDAGLGLFVHWDEASVRGLETSWPMMAGTRVGWGKIEIKDDPAEFARIVREQDYNLDGKKPQITPNEYWALAKEFDPTNFHPEVWLKKAKDAGFTYAVLTTKHHNGFALWPSAYGGFNTENGPMKGRDLVKEYVDACRKVGLKVGLYFSGPDWHFDRDYQDFLYYGTASKYRGKLPELDANLEPRTVQHTPEEIAAHQKAVAEMVRGQITELLTRYGKIDLIWFDGTPSIPNPGTIISRERIHELQPGIVINQRFKGIQGDFITPERKLSDNLHLKADEWGELCSTWSAHWSYTGQPYRPLNNVLTELVRCRAAGINNLLDIGPMPSGDLPPEAYENIAKVSAWMKVNGEAIHGTRALQGNEAASVPASSKGAVRYLYLLPGKDGGSAPTAGSVSITGLHGDYQAQLLGDDQTLTITTNGDSMTVSVPADVAGGSVRVVKLARKDQTLSK